MSEPEPPGHVKGICSHCGKPIRNTHGWIDQDGTLTHYNGNCVSYQLDDAYNLLARVRWAIDEGYDEIADVAHAICDEITEMIGPSE